MAQQINVGQQQKLAEALRLAYSGDIRFAWLHKIVVSAGYAKTYGGNPEELIIMPTLAIARGFGTTPRTVLNWIKGGCPVYQYGKTRQDANLYNFIEVLNWYKKKYINAKTTDGETDLFLVSRGNSPNLEKLRQEKVREAKRKNEIEEGLLVETAVVSAQLAEVGKTFRIKAEMIERTYGREIGNAVRKMIEETRKNWEKINLTPKKKRKNVKRKRKK